MRNAADRVFLKPEQVLEKEAVSPMLYERVIGLR